MVGGVALLFVLGLAVCLLFVIALLSMFVFNSFLPLNFNSLFTVSALSISVSTSPFSGLIALVFE